jgi:chromosomal replication initiation ATPase DnaA
MDRVFSVIPRSVLNPIVRLVGQWYAIPPATILGHDQSKTPTAARHLVCYLLREVGGYSYQEIGAALGKHHTSVIHGHNRVLRGADPEELKRLCQEVRVAARRKFRLPEKRDGDKIQPSV